MTYLLWSALSVLFGGLLGLGYFGGLWYTLEWARGTQQSTFLLLGSFIVRSAIVLAGFYLVIRLMGTHWEMVAFCLIGFMGARLLLVRRWGPHDTRSPSTDSYVNA